jgi:hypothetical protein
MSMSNQTETSPNPTIQLILAWGFVGVPLAWGVLETLQNAMKLFQ